MRLFKKKDKTEVCGYMNKYGEFFKDKKDRDYSNYLDERLTLENHFDKKLRDEKAYYFPDIPNIEKDKYIEYILESGTAARIIIAYEKHNKDLNDLKLKYKQ